MHCGVLSKNYSAAKELKGKTVTKCIFSRCLHVSKDGEEVMYYVV